MKRFADLSEQEILALAISNEDEDSRIYRSFADALRGLPALKRECLDPDSLKRVRAMKSQHVALAGRIQRHLRERIL